MGRSIPIPFVCGQPRGYFKYGKMRWVGRSENAIQTINALMLESLE
jgi:hypothetical protein